MAAPQSYRSRACRAGGAARFALALLATALLLAGCLQDAADTHYKFNNANDTTPSGGGSSGDSSGVTIFLVDDFTDVVVIVNQNTTDEDLDQWSLENNDGSKVYAFSGFTLTAAKAVRVHSASGTDDDNDLYADTDGADWGNGTENETAILINASGSPISSCSTSDACWP